MHVDDGPYTSISTPINRSDSVRPNVWDSAFAAVGPRGSLRKTMPAEWKVQRLLCSALVDTFMEAAAEGQHSSELKVAMAR